MQNYSILTKTIDQHRPWMIFVGEESGLAKIYAKQIAYKQIMEIITTDTVKEAIANIDNESILNPGTNIYKLFYILNDEEFAKDDKQWAELESRQKKNIIFITHYTNLDKRSKLYKQKEDMFFEFTKMTPEQLSRYIMKEAEDLDAERAQELAGYCDCDYLLCMNEANKLKHYHAVEKQSMNDCYDEFKKCGIFRTGEGNLFSFVDAVLAYDVRKMFNQWRWLGKGDNELPILSLLYKGFRNILVLQNDPGGKGSCERTGLNPWEYKKASEFRGKWKEEDLLDIIFIIQKAEQDLKIGKIDVKQVIDYVLINL